MIHALVVLAGIVGLAPVLSYLPMASMAALLLIVAWNMSRSLRRCTSIKVLLLGICWYSSPVSLAVLFDIVIAISVGIVLASMLFMREIAGNDAVQGYHRTINGCRNPIAQGLAGLPD